MQKQVFFTHKNLSNSVAGFKYQYKWVVTYGADKFIVEVIHSAISEQIRIYINDKIEAIKNQNDHQNSKFRFSHRINEFIFIEIEELDAGFDLLINHVSYKAYMSKQEDEQISGKQKKRFAEDLRFDYISIDDDYLSKIIRRVQGDGNEVLSQLISFKKVTLNGTHIF